MAIANQNYWPDNFWPDDYWPEQYWPVLVVNIVGLLTANFSVSITSININSALPIVDISIYKPKAKEIEANKPTSNIAVNKPKTDCDME